MGKELKNILYSGIIGFAIGDALGVPVEFVEREELESNPITCMEGFGSYNQPEGTWSDDTSMTLATLDALDKNEISREKIMKNFLLWFINGKYTPFGVPFDIGRTTLNAIQIYVNSNSLDICGQGDFYNNGNGSLMRMLPIAYYLYFSKIDDMDKRKDIVYSISALTHSNEISKIACLYYVCLAINIMKNKKLSLKKIIINSIEEIDEYYLKNENKILINKYLHSDNLLESLNLKKEELESTGFVINTLEVVLWALYNNENYSDTVLKVINLGEDTDTNGAIAGSLAGLYYGLENLPKIWIDSLQNKKIIENICKNYLIKLSQ